MRAPAGVVTGPITVTWGAVDAQAGVAWYDLDVSVDGGPWQRVLTQTPITNYQHTNPPNTHVTFRVTATDHVSNAASALARTSVVRVTKYYYHGGARVALRTSGAGGGVVYWLHGDHLGSVTLLTDYALRVTAQQRFLPYGGVRYSEGTFPTDVGFTGHRGHPALGLIFMRARYYHSGLGRFVSADTVVPGVGSQALNRYSYVLGNPLRFIDPTGHKQDTPPVGCEHSPQCMAWWRESIVKFRGNWSAGHRAAVANGAWAVANRLTGVVANQQAMVMQIPVEQRRYVPESVSLSSLWGLSPREVFHAVYGEVTFLRASTGDVPGMWAASNQDGWVQGSNDLPAWFRSACPPGNICYDASVFTRGTIAFNEVDGHTQLELNAVHELTHWLDHRGGRKARAHLVSTWSTASLQRGAGGWAGDFPGWQQSNEPGEGEVLADMGIGWTYGRWANDRLGALRASYMKANMPVFIALAVAGN